MSLDLGVGERATRVDLPSTFIDFRTRVIDNGGFIHDKAATLAGIAAFEATGLTRDNVVAAGAANWGVKVDLINNVNFPAQPAVGNTITLTGTAKGQSYNRTWTFIANGQAPVGDQIALGADTAGTATNVKAVLDGLGFTTTQPAATQVLHRMAGVGPSDKLQWSRIGGNINFSVMDVPFYRSLARIYCPWKEAGDIVLATPTTIAVLDQHVNAMPGALLYPSSGRLRTSAGTSPNSKSHAIVMARRTGSASNYQTLGTIYDDVSGTPAAGLRQESSGALYSAYTNPPNVNGAGADGASMVVSATAAVVGQVDVLAQLRDATNGLLLRKNGATIDANASATATTSNGAQRASLGIRGGVVSEGDVLSTIHPFFFLREGANLLPAVSALEAYLLGLQLS